SPALPAPPFSLRNALLLPGLARGDDQLRAARRVGDGLAGDGHGLARDRRGIAPVRRRAVARAAAIARAAPVVRLAQVTRILAPFALAARRPGNEARQLLQRALVDVALEFDD